MQHIVTFDSLLTLVVATLEDIIDHFGELGQGNCSIKIFDNIAERQIATFVVVTEPNPIISDDTNVRRHKAACSHFSPLKKESTALGRGPSTVPELKNATKASDFTIGKSLRTEKF